MDAKAILVKIEQDAREAAQRIHSDAEEKAKAMKLEAQANVEMLLSTMLAQAEQECQHMEERMHRMAELDNRKALLAMKREVIDEAFQMAKEKLLNTKPAERRAFYLKQTVKCARGEETLIVGADDAGWFDDGFLGDANRALQAAGKPARLQLKAERRKGCAGIVLSFKGAEVRITFESLLDEARADMEQLAAQALFTE
ncbi:MAG: V-type ATP synthase subunit E family protein [Bacillota bacterium]